MAVAFKKEIKQIKIPEETLRADPSVKILVQRISEMRVSEEGGSMAQSKLSMINQLQLQNPNLKFEVANINS